MKALQEQIFYKEYDQKEIFHTKVQYKKKKGNMHIKIVVFQYGKIFQGLFFKM